MSGKTTRGRVASMFFTFLLLSSVFTPFAPVAGDAWDGSGLFEDRLHVERQWDGILTVMDLKLSTNKVHDGSTLTVSVTMSAFKHGETIRDLKEGVSYLGGVYIRVFYGSVEVLSNSPELTTGTPYNGVINLEPDGATVYWGVTSKKGANGYEATIEDRMDAFSGEIIDPVWYCYDSPTTFTATFKLLKETEIEINGSHSPPVVVAGNSYEWVCSRQFLKTGTADRFSGKVYDVQTNILKSVAIREVPIPNMKVGLYTFPDMKLVKENTTQADGSYQIKPDNFDPTKEYYIQAKIETSGKEVKQQIKVDSLGEVDIYLPRGLVKNYLALVNDLNNIKLPLLSDVDLLLGLGFGGPLRETSLYGPLAELAKLGVEIDVSESNGLRERLEKHLDNLLSESPQCESLVRVINPKDPWANLLRLTIVMSFIKNRVPDTYYSIDNVVKGATVAVMTALMMDRIKSAGVGKQNTVDKYTPAFVRNAQNWLLDKSNKNAMKIANTIHVTVFAGGFGMGGVDLLLNEIGIKNPEYKSVAKTILAKVIRFGISDFLRKNMGTSLAFEIMFQTARTIGDVSILQLYLYISRNELSRALENAENGMAEDSNLVMLNKISVFDTQHDGWHKTQHSWAISWFKAANVFRGLAGFHAFWASVPGGTAVVQPLVKKLMSAAPWLKYVGLGSFAGVVITETRAFIVTWWRQDQVVNASFTSDYRLVEWIAQDQLKPINVGYISNDPEGVLLCDPAVAFMPLISKKNAHTPNYIFEVQTGLGGLTSS